jgi:class 3 adenylate cyclase
LVNAQREAAGRIPIHIGMGVHFGKLALGIIGEPERLEATVIGDAVNTASRIEALTKAHGVDALVSAAARAQLAAPGQFSFRFVEQAEIRGKTEKIAVYELLEAKTAF